jgi:hypothetical protein
MSVIVGLSDMRAVSSVVASPVVSSHVATTGDPFAWLRPDISVSEDSLRRMDQRDVVSWMLPSDGDDLALFVGSTIRTDARSFGRAIDRPERLWSGPQVRHIVRFSTPPGVEDVAQLALDDRDLDSLRTCRPGDCDVKLSEPEIARVKAAIERSHGAWQTAAQDEFRRIVLDRATAYLARGQRGFEPYVDKAPVDPQRAFEDVVRQMALVTTRLPELASYFDEFPRTSRLRARSFLFWLETTYTPKPTIQIVHAVAFEPESTGRTPEVVVAWRQVYSTHYVNALLSISALLRDERDPSRRYLAYVNHSTLDGLQGWLRGMKRHLVEGRVRDTAEALFEAQRQQIESAPLVSSREYP